MPLSETSTGNADSGGKSDLSFGASWNELATSVTNVPRLRLLTPTMSTSPETYPSSSSEWTSSSTSSPSEWACPSSVRNSWSERHAAISSTASAPASLACSSWYSLTMNSLRRIGMETSFRASETYSSFPPKYFASVRIDSAEAPPEAYEGTTSFGEMSWWIHPRDGDLRLNSAMMPEPETRAFLMLREEGEAASALDLRSSSGRRAISSFSSMRLSATMRSRMSMSLVEFQEFPEGGKGLPAF